MFKKKKVKDEIENEWILLHGECDNCGSPLKYNKKDYSCKCDYCGTEYYVTQDGELKGQYVELEIFGEKHKFYMSNIENCNLYGACGRTKNGTLYSNLITRKMKVTLIEI